MLFVMGYNNVLSLEGEYLQKCPDGFHSYNLIEIRDLDHLLEIAKDCAIVVSGKHEFPGVGEAASFYFSED